QRAAQPTCADWRGCGLSSWSPRLEAEGRAHQEHSICRRARAVASLGIEPREAREGEGVLRRAVDAHRLSPHSPNETRRYRDADGDVPDAGERAILVRARIAVHR